MQSVSLMKKALWFMVNDCIDNPDHKRPADDVPKGHRY